jgi:hypothetical protein
MGGDAEVFVRRWNGSIWEELDGSASGGGISNAGGATTLGATNPSIAVDSTGRITVAYKHADLPGGACCDLWTYVRRWDGTRWEELDGSATGMGLTAMDGGSHPAVAVDDSDNIYVAWHQSGPGICDAYLLMWNGSGWQELGGSASGNGVSNIDGGGDPGVAVDRTGNPIVAWPFTDQTDFDARRWTGSTWEALGSIGSSGGCLAGGAVSVTVDASNAPVVAQRDSGGTRPIRVARFDGSGWEALPSPDSTSSAPEVAALPGGELLLAWDHFSASREREIYVARWNGSTWEELDGSSSGGGISDTTAGQSYAPHVATGF